MEKGFGAMIDALSNGPAGAKQALHRIVQALKSGAVQISFFDGMNRSENPEVKKDITAFHRLAAGMPRKIVNAKGLLDQLQVPEETQEQIKERFPRAKLFAENFQFVPAEFLKHVALRTVELDNGGLLTAATERFDNVFTSETVDASKEVVRFTTQGKIVDQRFRKVNRFGSRSLSTLAKCVEIVVPRSSPGLRGLCTSPTTKNKSDLELGSGY
jgi:hypothetical protein